MESGQGVAPSMIFYSCMTAEHLYKHEKGTKLAEDLCLESDYPQPLFFSSFSQFPDHFNGVAICHSRVTAIINTHWLPSPFFNICF